MDILSLIDGYDLVKGGLQLAMTGLVLLVFHRAYLYSRIRMVGAEHGQIVQRLMDIGGARSADYSFLD